MARTRLADIADKAGVSEATVSRVLNARPGVKQTTVQAVLTAVDVLGYERPTRLRARRAGLVGLVVPELTNPSFPAFAEWIERGLTRQGYTSVLCTQTPGGMPEQTYVQMLLDQGVAGIIFISAQHADTRADHSHYAELIEQRLPVAFINGYVEELAAPFVSCDDRVAIELALRHLISLGHRRIALVTGPPSHWAVQRKAARFVAALGKMLRLKPADVEPLISTGIFSVEGGHAGARQVLDRGASAIVCGSDMMALGAIRAVRDRGLSVPNDVSVVGYDDSMMMAFTDPPLTTVRQPVPEMSMAAVRLLMDEIEGQRLDNSEYLFQPELVARDSTGPARGGSAAVSRQ